MATILLQLTGKEDLFCSLGRCFSLFEPRLDVLTFKTNQKVIYKEEHEQQNELIQTI